MHDPLGRRIAKKVGGTVTEKYLWEGLTRLLAVYDGSDNLLMRFEYADARMPVAMTAGSVKYYLAYDQAGTLKAVADSSGNAVKRIEYDTFGNIINDTAPAFAVPFGFAGGLYDKDTKLVRFGYRDYDPDTGRWTAKDPIGFGGGDTDLYGYAFNDPVNCTDPSGLSFWGSFAGGVVTGLATGAMVAGAAAGAILLGVPAVAVTSGLVAIGAIGGIATVASMVANPSADNIGFNLGALTGGAVIGGFTGRSLACKLSPPEHQPAPGWAGWNPLRDMQQIWRFNTNEPIGVQLNNMMNTGPNPLNAAGDVAFGGSGAARKEE